MVAARDRWLRRDWRTLSSLDAAVPLAMRPIWAADIVAVARATTPDLPEDSSAAMALLVQIGEDQERWHESRQAFQQLRALTLREAVGDQERPHAPTTALRVAESAAKVIYNATGLPAPYDRTAGIALLAGSADLAAWLTSSDVERLWLAVTLAGRPARVSPRAPWAVERPEGSEADFWSALAHRVSRELAGFEDATLRANWCDGLLPEHYEFQAAEPCIRGRAFCGPTGQEHWTFSLLTGEPGRSGSDLNWRELLPPDDVTGWLSVHLERRSLIIDPTSAYPDPTTGHSRS